MEQQIPTLRKCILENEDIAPFEKILNDTFLENFLNAKKGNIEIALESVTRYIQLKKTFYPKTLWDDFPTNCDMFYANGTIRLLKNKDKLGRGILVFDVEHWKPDYEHPIEEFCQHMTAIADYITLSSDFQTTKGILTIVDCRNYSVNQVRLANPAYLKGILKIAFMYPARIKALHMLIINSFLKAFFVFLGKLLPAKISKRLHVHNSLKTLHNSLELSKEFLPTKIGGNLEGDEAFDMIFPQKVLDNGPFRHEFYRIWKENFNNELHSEG